MSKEYNIQTVADIFALTAEQRERCCIDLLTLGRMIDADKEINDSDLTIRDDRFTWKDDDKVGTVSGFEIGGRRFDFQDDGAV